MSDVKLMAENNKIYECEIGSFVYGTNIETSDHDYGGVFLPSKEFILGFERVEECDLSIKDKLENGKNSDKAIDRKLYEYRKFIKLVQENNPNIIEYLFVPDNQVLYINSYGKNIRDNKSMFLFKGLKQKFLGYAYAQKHKMIVKADHYNELLDSLDFLDSLANEEEFLLQVVLNKEHKSQHKFQLNYRNNSNRKDVSYISIADLSIQPSYSIKKAKSIILERVKNTTHRKECYVKDKIDLKFGMHLVRLLIEGKELLETGNLIYPLQERKLLLDIRNGLLSIDDILNEVAKYEEFIKNETTTLLPSNPKYKEIQDFTMEELSRWMVESGMVKK